MVSCERRGLAGPILVSPHLRSSQCPTFKDSLKCVIRVRRSTRYPLSSFSRLLKTSRTTLFPHRTSVAVRANMVCSRRRPPRSRAAAAETPTLVASNGVALTESSPELGSEGKTVDRQGQSRQARDRTDQDRACTDTYRIRTDRVSASHRQVSFRVTRIDRPDSTREFREALRVAPPDGIARLVRLGSTTSTC